MTDFATTVHGKWILTGEHAVLRGQPALIFPVRDYTLNLRYQAGPESLQINLQGNFTAEPDQIINPVLQEAMRLLGKARLPGGDLELTNAIPVRSGMGASAALCVVLGQWLAHIGWLDSLEIEHFARQLEHIFHGESSGADIAVVLRDQGIYFQPGKEVRNLQPHWQPNWYLSHSGEQGSTAACIQQVKQLFTDQPATGQKLDQIMRDSVELAYQALQSPPEVGLNLLSQAIAHAAECFYGWNLITPGQAQHMQALQQAGALATKPTGSGGGGFVLSLWPTGITPQLNFPIIAV